MTRAEHERWMVQCLALAKKGSGSVSPNPLVGSVVVLNGSILGKGYHRRFGSAHAEINAIRDALSHGKDLNGATLYVNLEPCAHHGNTPPCAEAIIRHGISHVVAAMEDPNPRVAGKGFRILREAGIRVTTGVLKSEAERLNEKFLTYISTGLPFVAIKVAQTVDGFIARADGSSRWITSHQSRIMVHRLRAEYDAVLVGAGTVIADDPQLTVRHVKGRNPWRIVIDGRLQAPLTSRVFRDKDRKRTILFISKKFSRKARALRASGVTVVALEGNKGTNISLDDILAELGKRGMASLLVEGGHSIYRQFLRERKAKKIYCFTAPTRFQRGLKPFGKDLGNFRIVRQAARQMGVDTFYEGSIAYRKVQ